MQPDKPGSSRGQAALVSPVWPGPGHEGCQTGTPVAAMHSPTVWAPTENSACTTTGSLLISCCDHRNEMQPEKPGSSRGEAAFVSPVWSGPGREARVHDLTHSPTVWAPTDQLFPHGAGSGCHRRKKRLAALFSTSAASGDQVEKEEPQPHVVVAFGLRITNCAPCRPSE